MDYRIIKHMDHYDVYIYDKFYCSADTFTEAVRELEEIGVA